MVQDIRKRLRNSECLISCTLVKRSQIPHHAEIVEILIGSMTKEYFQFSPLHMFPSSTAKSNISAFKYKQTYCKRIPGKTFDIHTDSPFSMRFVRNMHEKNKPSFVKECQLKIMHVRLSVQFQDFIYLLKRAAYTHHAKCLKMYWVNLYKNSSDLLSIRCYPYTLSYLLVKEYVDIICRRKIIEVPLLRG